MTQVRFANVTHEPLFEPVQLRPRKRRLDKVVRRWTRGLDSQFIVSVVKPGQPLVPSNDNTLIRNLPKGIKAHEVEFWESRRWQNTVVGRDDIVLITVVPEGGGRGGAAKIAVSIAAIALMVFAGPIAGALLGPGANAFALAAVKAGVTIGAAALMMVVARQNQDNRQIYGVSGGGNLPRPNDRIPVGYGEFWNPADLTQPDYYRYENSTDTILFKRVCLGCGKYKVLEIRVGTTTFWSGSALSPNGGVVSSGITATFPNCKFEVLYGAESTLVPFDVVTSSNVTGQAIPLQGNPSTYLGPFATNPVGTTVTKLQVDYSTPSGYAANNHETVQDLHFEYATIDAGGSPTSAWQTLYRTTAAFYTTKNLRFSQTKDVPEGRYAVRVRNNVPDYSGTQDIAWDALRGYKPDTRVRENLTEVAFEIRASKGLGITSFSDIQIKVQRVGPVWNADDEVWEEGPIRKCVDIFPDMLRDENYGGAFDDDLIDLAKCVAYRSGVTAYDTFDGLIRGPASLWEAMHQVMSNMRAEPIRIGSGFSFVRDEPSVARRHSFTRSQIVRETATIEETPEADDGSAHVIVEFSPGSDPKRKDTAEAVYGSPSLTPRRITWPGISTYEHAVHLARWLAASGYNRRTTISFDTELMGRIPFRGDAIFVDPWFIDGRKVSAVLSISSNTLTIDSDITVSGGDYCTLRDKTGREWGPVRVTQGGDLRTLILNSTDVTAEVTDTGLALAAVLAADTSILTSAVVGPLADIGTTWLVDSMTPGENGRTSISAKIDSTAVYDAIGAAIPPQSALSWPLIPQVSPDILDLQANCVQHTSSIEVQWSIKAEAGAETYEVLISYAADGDAYEPLYMGTGAVGSAPMRYLDAATCWLKARAYGSTGVPGQWSTVSFTTPKPIVVATDVEDGLITLPKLGADAATLFAGELGNLLGLAAEFVARETSTDEQKVAFGQAMAAITTTRTLLASGDAALADLITTVSASLNAAFASSSIRFTSVVAPGGIAARIALEVKAGTMASWGQAGLFIDVVETGVGTGIYVGKITLRADLISFENASALSVIYWDTVNNRMVFKGGEIIAGLFRDENSRMVIDATYPRIVVKDESNVTRVVMGKLD